ncbi:MAG: DUF4880 domain-containing protein [Oxalicibacterium faecigallinarum]|uniref:DUF4880 domain-containing protein n=1 Tax=Oxalicibacterium faecigallinarum TaxID=573741 RepID=UPI0028072D85|nr:DUF4880 domain-containing protein [Oxalicibacterium faecigallinarum]MDQ7970596.1 DUF4880 domain-containing protein [Oxalicibacterium faecigallinarum]
MASDTSLPASISPAILDEAVGWLMRFQSGEVDAALQQDFDCWLKADALHLAAWKKAEEVMQTFSVAPATAGRQALAALSPVKATRSRVLRLLGVASAVLPFLNFLWRGDVGEI